jgi:hypothetical protein
MLDFMLMLAEQSLNESNQNHAVAYGAILIALLDKGVITQDEYDRAYILAQHIISQEFAKKREEAGKDKG